MLNSLKNLEIWECSSVKCAVLYFRRSSDLITGPSVQHTSVRFVLLAVSTPEGVGRPRRSHLQPARGQLHGEWRHQPGNTVREGHQLHPDALNPSGATCTYFCLCSHLHLNSQFFICTAQIQCSSFAAVSPNQVTPVNALLRWNCLYEVQKCLLLIIISDKGKSELSQAFDFSEK